MTDGYKDYFCWSDKFDLLVITTFMTPSCHG